MSELVPEKELAILHTGWLEALAVWLMGNADRKEGQPASFQTLMMDAMMIWAKWNYHRHPLPNEEFPLWWKTIRNYMIQRSDVQAISEAAFTDKLINTATSDQNRTPLVSQSTSRNQRISAQEVSLPEQIREQKWLTAKVCATHTGLSLPLQPFKNTL